MNHYRKSVERTQGATKVCSWARTMATSGARRILVRTKAKMVTLWMLQLKQIQKEYYFSQEISMSGKFNLKTGKSIPNQVIQGLFDSDDDENQKPQDKEDLLPKFVPSATQRGPTKAQIMN